MVEKYDSFSSMELLEFNKLGNTLTTILKKKINKLKNQNSMIKTIF